MKKWQLEKKNNRTTLRLILYFFDRRFTLRETTFRHDNCQWRGSN